MIYSKNYLIDYFQMTYNISERFQRSFIASIKYNIICSYLQYFIHGLINYL